MHYMYAVGVDLVARINLDDGYEDARAHYPDGVLEGDNLEAYAERLVDEALENQDLTDDPEEYRARYVSASRQAYAEEIREMRQVNEEVF